VKESRKLVEEAMAALKVPTISHGGNFIMLRLPIGDTLAYRLLMARGYMVRSMTTFRFPGWVRVSLSHNEVMRGFISSLTEILADTQHASTTN
jgi:histidinol-phosphate aminotransferase